jgi:hypothetical protein
MSILFGKLKHEVTYDRLLDASRPFRRLAGGNRNSGKDADRTDCPLAKPIRGRVGIRG